MRTCMLCGIQTEGSVGAAGLRWKTICQPCKDREDGALADTIKRQSATIDLVMDKLFSVPANNSVRVDE